MKKNADRFITATYCDDIRQEAGNKISLMGCYQGELNVQSAPSALPKLCAYVSIVTTKERPIKTLTIRVMLDDVELASLEIPEAGLREAAQNHDAASTRLMVSTALMFAPFVIEKPTSLRILATTEEGEMIGPRLSIKVQAMQATPEQAVAQPAAKQPTKRKSASRRPTTH